MKLIQNAFLLVLSAVLCISCASYQLGTPSQNEYSKVFVSPVANDSSYPLLEASLTHSLRAAINETGTLLSTPKSKAQRLLKVKISKVDRSQLAVQAQDLGRGKKFGLQLHVEYSLYDLTNNNAVIFENKSISVDQDIFVDSDVTATNAGNQVDAEYQAGPEVSKKIATRIAESLTDLW